MLVDADGGGKRAAGTSEPGIPAECVVALTGVSAVLRAAGWRCVGIVHDCARVAHCHLLYYGCRLSMLLCANGRIGI